MMRFSGLDHLKACRTELCARAGLWPSTPFRRAVKPGDEVLLLATPLARVPVSHRGDHRRRPQPGASPPDIAEHDDAGDAAAGRQEPPNAPSPLRRPAPAGSTSPSRSPAELRETAPRRASRARVQVRAVRDRRRPKADPYRASSGGRLPPPRPGRPLTPTPFRSPLSIVSDGEAPRCRGSRSCRAMRERSRMAPTTAQSPPRRRPARTCCDCRRDARR